MPAVFHAGSCDRFIDAEQPQQKKTSKNEAKFQIFKTVLAINIM